MKKLRYSAWLLRVLLGGLLALPAIAKEHTKPVMISSELKSFSMAHNGETVMVMRNQDRSNRIVELYQPTYRGKIQPMHPFAPHAVTTIGALEIMEEWFNVLNTGLSLDFSNAKTLVLFCNGIWCGQSPTTIRTLLRMGYPAAKIHYFRGGMQNWQSLGLTVVSP